MASSGRGKVLAICLAAYFLALTIAIVTAGTAPPDWHPVSIALAADIAATIVIFLIGWTLRNSSLYDPYWSVAPLVIVLYWFSIETDGQASVFRPALAIILVYAWGIRLTFNCFRRWTDFAHEDFRYRDLRQSSGSLYPLVDLFGIQLLPTILVFAGCLPLFPAMTAETPFNLLDIVAVLVTGFGIFYEWLADRQLRRFLDRNDDPGKVCKDGIWKRSRHPNYLGELSFWWGLWLFALAADPSYWWTAIGALAITLLFVFISIPMMQKRQSSRRKNYEEQVAGIPLLIPKLGD